MQKKIVQVKRKYLNNVHAEVKKQSCTPNGSKKNNMQKQNDLRPPPSLSSFFWWCVPDVSQINFKSEEVKGGGGRKTSKSLQNPELKILVHVHEVFLVNQLFDTALIQLPLTT